MLLDDGLVLLNERLGLNDRLGHSRRRGHSRRLVVVHERGDESGRDGLAHRRRLDDGRLLATAPAPRALAPVLTPTRASAAARAGTRRTGAVTVATPLDGLGVDDHSAPGTVLARFAEDLKQALPDSLAGHLHQAQRGDLGHLVLGAVTAQALEQPAQHQVAVDLEHHVDEVDDDDAADVT